MKSDNPDIERKEAIPPFDSRHVRYDRVRVASTITRGLGVFTLTPIRSGRAVGRVLGTLKPKDFRSDYCIEFGDNTLDPAPPYRFLNHSCTPNCEFIEWKIDEGVDLKEGKNHPVILELWLHALRFIQVGEELTVDYGWDWHSAIPCLCGSPNCRGWICKEKELELCKAFHSTESPH